MEQAFLNRDPNADVLQDLTFTLELHLESMTLLSRVDDVVNGGAISEGETSVMAASHTYLEIQP